MYIYENSYFSIVGLQTDDTLILANKVFVAAEEEELQKAKFIVKLREELLPNSLLKFNRGTILLIEDNSITLT